MDALERLETLISEAQMAVEQPVQIFKHVCFQFQGVNYICKGKHILETHKMKSVDGAYYMGKVGAVRKSSALIFLHICTHCFSSKNCPVLKLLISLNCQQKLLWDFQPFPPILQLGLSKLAGIYSIYTEKDSTLRSYVKDSTIARKV